MTFWDFCAPVYDFAQRHNGGSFEKMISVVEQLAGQMPMCIAVWEK